MVDSTSVRPATWRWSRQVASFIARGVLAAVSSLVLAYGTIQMTMVLMEALVPLAPSPLSSLSISEVLHAAARFPAVQLVGPIMVDPVLNPASLQTVGISVGVVVLGALGITVAKTAPHLHQHTTEAGSLSAALPSVHDFIGLVGKPRSRVAQDAKLFSQQAAVYIIGTCLPPERFRHSLVAAT